MVAVASLLAIAAGWASAQAPSPTATATVTAQATAASAKPEVNQDWANLNRYRADNEALAAPAAGQKRVVFMGDSITDGWGRSQGTGAFFPGRLYINRGISGQTTPQMLIRFEPDVVHLHPAVVVILAGTNDIAGNTGPSSPEMIEDNLAAMTAIAQSNGIAVVLASITPVGRYPWKPDVEAVAPIKSVNTWMRNFCAHNGCTYLDAMADAQGAMAPGLSKDGVHPLETGYAIMAPLAEKAIAQAMLAGIHSHR
jgi:lysophospholipase L1-like esterase